MSAESKMVNETRVGLLVFMSLVVLMLAILSIGTNQQTFKKQVTYVVKFDKLNGLEKGSQVRLNGVQVGSVSEIEIPPTLNDSRIRVKISVDDNVKQWIREDSRAKIQSIGVLGDKYIELTLGSPDKAQLPPGSEIPAVSPLSLDSLLSGSDELINDIHQVTKRAGEVLARIEEGKGTLGILANKDDLHREMVSLVKDIRATAEKLGNDLDRAAHAFGKASDKAGTLFDKLNNKNGTISKLASDSTAHDKLVAFLDQGKKAMETLNKSADTLHSILKKVDNGEGTLGMFVNDPGLYREVENVIIGLGKVSMFRRAIRKARKEGEKERKKRGY